MAIDHKEILNDVENQIRGLTAATQSKTLPIDPVVIARPTQADLKVVTEERAEKKQDPNSGWEDPMDLAVHALLHRSWAMEVERKGWSVSEIGNPHIKALRLAQAAWRLIPKREGNV